MDPILILSFNPILVLSFDPPASVAGTEGGGYCAVAAAVAGGREQLCHAPKGALGLPAGEQPGGCTGMPVLSKRDLNH